MVNGERDLDALMLDGTAVPAHQHAAGVQKKTGAQAIGRSRGGLPSKIHAVVDALGNPVRWLLTGVAVADITRAEPLLDGLKADAVLADKGYTGNRHGWRQPP